jgi:hypothetical protein
MPASTTIISDLATVRATAPTAATKAKALTAPELDIVGELSAAQAAIIQARTSLNNIVAATDSADPNLATLNNVLLSLT